MEQFLRRFFVENPQDEPQEQLNERDKKESNHTGSMSPAVAQRLSLRGDTIASSAWYTAMTYNADLHRNEAFLTAAGEEQTIPAHVLRKIREEIDG